MHRRYRNKASEVAGYPFDVELLLKSRLYKRSRELFLKAGGRFEPSLISSARSLGSPALLDDTIEYSPLERELRWTLTDSVERRRRGSRAAVLRYMSSLFHEQNHRVLWRLLPPAPRSAAALRRYLNLAESLVIVADMALGDELGPRVAKALRDANVVYDPGTAIKRDLRSARDYRNYLQACLHATYLALEGFEPKAIRDIVRSLYSPPLTAVLARRAADRALRLNPGFIRGTNLVWQRKHRARVIERLGERLGARSGRGGRPPLALDADPLNNIEQYKLAEAWFDQLGL